MKNQSLFNRTIGILVKAYFDGTLLHGYCASCAVGNIVGANNGKTCDIIRPWVFSDGTFPLWERVFVTSFFRQKIYINKYEGDAKKEIDSTGYSLNELASIEFSFETASREGDWEFNGLMSVCDTLMQIHECSIEEIEDAKAQFVRV